MKDDVLACMPVPPPPYTVSVVPGSVIRDCPDCDRQIYISPSGQRLLESNQGLEAVCLTCCGKRQRAQGGEKPEILMAPGAAAELLKNGVDPLTVAALKARIKEVKEDGPDG